MGAVNNAYRLITPVPSLFSVWRFFRAIIPLKIFTKRGGKEVQVNIGHGGKIPKRPVLITAIKFTPVAKH